MCRFLGRCCEPGEEYNLKYIDPDGVTVWKFSALDSALLIHKVVISSDGLSLYVGTWKVAASGINLAWPCLAKYDLTSGTPELIWQKTRQQMRDHALGNIEGAKVLSLALDGDANLLVGCGGRMLCKFDPAGALIWRQFLATSAFEFGIHSLAIDGSNNIFCGTDAWGPFAAAHYNLSRVTAAGVVNWNVGWNDAHSRSSANYPGYFFSGLGNLAINTKTTLALMYDGSRLYAGSFASSASSYAALSKLVPGASGGSLHEWLTPPVSQRTSTDMGSVMSLHFDAGGRVVTSHRGSSSSLTGHRDVLQRRETTGGFLVGYPDPDSPAAASTAVGSCRDASLSTRHYLLRLTEVDRWFINPAGGAGSQDWAIDWTDTAPDPAGPHCCVTHPTGGVIVGGDFTQ